MTKTSIMSRGVAVLAISLFAVGISASVASAAPMTASKQSKVTICHYDADAGTYHPITISSRAVAAHMANHPDMSPSADGLCTSEQLVETLAIPANSVEATASQVLQADTSYRLEVSGTYTYGVWNEAIADAKYSYRSIESPVLAGAGWVEGSTLPSPYTNYLQLWVDGAPAAWNGSLDTHTYTMTITGDGTPLEFAIQDGTDTGDNTGGLIVKIYKQL